MILANIVGQPAVDLIGGEDGLPLLSAADIADQGRRAMQHHIAGFASHGGVLRQRLRVEQRRLLRSPIERARHRRDTDRKQSSADDENSPSLLEHLMGAANAAKTSPHCGKMAFRRSPKSALKAREIVGRSGAAVNAD